MGPFFNNAVPQNFKSQGIYIGTGDQDNYLKVALNANGGQGGIEVVLEQAGVPASYQYPLSGGLPANAVDLYLAVDPVTGLVQPKYAQDGGAITNLGEPLAVGGALLTAMQSTPALAVGAARRARGGRGAGLQHR